MKIILIMQIGSRLGWYEGCSYSYMDHFGIHLYVTFFMVAFVISFHGDYVGWQGDLNVAIYSLVE